jgi:hypothetical protein
LRKQVSTIGNETVFPCQYSSITSLWVGSINDSNKSRYELRTMVKTCIFIIQFYPFISILIAVSNSFNVLYIHILRRKFPSSVLIIWTNYFNNHSSVISWRSVLLVEKIGVTGKNHQTAASQWQTFSYNVVSSTFRHERVRTHNVSGD